MNKAVIDRNVTRRGAPDGYTLVLPPGWRQIPVRAGTRQVIRKIVNDTFRPLARQTSRDKLAPYRIALERRLTSAVTQARQHGGTELYLPVEPVHGTLLAASFVVSEGTIGAHGHHDPALIVSSIISGGQHSAPVSLDGAAGFRTEATAPPDPARGIDNGSRRVDYAVIVPGTMDRWLVSAFSALGAGDPGDKFAGLLAGLFDAIMSTFRWTHPGNSEHTRGAGEI